LPCRDQTSVPVAASSTLIVRPLPSDVPVASTRLPSTAMPLIPPVPPTPPSCANVHSGAPVAASYARTVPFGSLADRQSSCATNTRPPTTACTIDRDNPAGSMSRCQTWMPVTRSSAARRPDFTA
jgi:hypothetical protein